eukprot:2703892-Amphidinium_carterae.1
MASMYLLLTTKLKPAFYSVYFLWFLHTNRSLEEQCHELDVAPIQHTRCLSRVQWKLLKQSLEEWEVEPFVFGEGEGG